ncbi:hypothetical protein AMATHDRAFT_5950 [Amanita thiersii Skay4041]|uniref:Uncharacterized protein n=1 Tax=Amanita thiersii Skay4041 TaxID=703135 RepID=A0A2A9NJ15_9AGAR|nr:hypothetical protein AMATHDRAFT_5950 [Amanita thiersii Skay4041]
MSATMTAMAPTSSTINSLTLSTSSGDTDSNANRVVRFDSECVLIPEKRRRRMLTKSLTLPVPLWKRRSSQLSDTESAEDPSSPTTPTAVEDSHVVIKVPIPSFMVRASRSPSSASSSPQPLSPCLVHRSPSSASTSPSSSSSISRKLSSSSSHKKKDRSIVTVPLRACCPDCVPITEECLREGDHWQVKFSRGARRRRSASLDETSTFALGRNSPTLDLIGFNGRAAASTADEDASPSTDVPDLPTTRPRLTITVDEVDKRRRSLDLVSDEDFRRIMSSVSNRSNEPWLPPSSNGSPSSRCFRREYPLSNNNELSPNLLSRQTARASPIQEEDEDQLFPLPSPRRTPSASPSSSLNLDPSPKVSPAPSPLSSTRSTPAPSPTGSTSCLGASLVKTGTAAPPDEPILDPSLRRKTPKPQDPTSDMAPRITAKDLNDQDSPLHHNVPPLPVAYTPQCIPTLSPITSSPDSPKANSPSNRAKKPSFSLPFLKAGADALKGAGSDVLKGRRSIIPTFALPVSYTSGLTVAVFV